MQLYSVDQKRSQALEAHAAAFATLKVCHEPAHMECCKCSQADRRIIGGAVGGGEHLRSYVYFWERILVGVT